jgi:cation:H+ antiporter
MKPLEWREAFWLVASLGMLWWCIADGWLSRPEGVLLLGWFGVYNVHVYVSARRGDAGGDEPVHTRRPWPEVALGIVGVAVGARLIVSGGESLATAAGISQRVIGLTVIAVGTSLPELAAGVGSALCRQTDISIGNVVGSNVFNVLPVLGIACLVRPIGGHEVSSEHLLSAERVDMPIVLGFTLAVIALPWFVPGRGGRLKGGLLLASYLAYTIFLFAGPGFSRRRARQPPDALDSGPAPRAAAAARRRDNGSAHPRTPGCWRRSRAPGRRSRGPARAGSRAR